MIEDDIDTVLQIEPSKDTNKICLSMEIKVDVI